MSQSQTRLYKVVIKRTEFSRRKSADWSEQYQWKYDTIEKELDPLILIVSAYSAKDAIDQTQILTLDAPFGLNWDMYKEVRPAIMHFIVSVEPAALEENNG